MMLMLGIASCNFFHSNSSIQTYVIYRAVIADDDAKTMTKFKDVKH